MSAIFATVLIRALSLALVPMTLVGSVTAQTDGGADPGRGRLTDVLPGARSQIEFVENRGQWDTPAAFIARGVLESGTGFVYRVEPDGLWLQYEGRSLEASGEGKVDRALFRMSFLGASPDARCIGELHTEELVSYYLGNDPQRWRTGIRPARQVRVEAVWDGIDVVLREGSMGLEYDLEVAPGADLEQIGFRLEGVDGLEVGGDGELLGRTAWGDLVQSAPRSFEQGVGGNDVQDRRHRALASRFELRGDGVFGFEVDEWDRGRPLVIDPGITWASYLGASKGDVIGAIALDDQDKVAATGSTESVDFPASPGLLSTGFTGVTPDDYEAFLIRIDKQTGLPIFSVFIGGSSLDAGDGLKYTSTGSLVVAGFTVSADFPVTTAAFDTVYDPSNQTFVARLSADGTILEYSTYLDGYFQQLELAEDDSPIVLGKDIFTSFVTTPGVLWPNPVGPTLARLSPDGSNLTWGTYILGPDTVMTVLDDESIIIAGPKQFAVEVGNVLHISADAQTLLAATTFVENSIHEVGTDSSGHVYISGITVSNVFPASPNAFSTQLGGSHDVYIAKLSPDLQNIVAATYLGSPQVVFGIELPQAMEVDPSGIVTVAGRPETAGFPTTPGAFEESGGPIFITRLSPSLDRLFYSTMYTSPFIEGFTGYMLRAMESVDHGTVMIAGETGINGLQVTPTAFQSQPSSLFHVDGYMVELDMLPTGVSKFGSSTPSCLGEISLGPTRMPADGDQAFSIYASGAPPNGLGLLTLGNLRDVPGTPLMGVNVHLGLTGNLFSYSCPPVDAAGFVERAMPIPPGFVGKTLHAQMFFVDLGACGSPGVFSASNALSITVQ